MFYILAFIALLLIMMNSWRWMQMWYYKWVGMQLKCNINSFPVVIKCHKILIVLLIFSFLNHMGKKRKKNQNHNSVMYAQSSR